MSVWDVYGERVGLKGTMRPFIIEQAKASISHMIYDSPSCRLVTIDGEERYVSITHRPDLSEKRICSVPGEHLTHGGLVEFSNSMWLITELDADNEIYDRGLMLRCNHKLRWINKDGELVEKWCVVEDGTKYLIGEYNEEIMSIGDARIALTIGRDKDTIALARGVRFIVDDPESESVTAYKITKSNKMFNVYDGEGVFKFILHEVNLTDEDNIELGIADYTSWKPGQHLDSEHRDSDLTIAEIVQSAKDEAAQKPSDDKEVWL